MNVGAINVYKPISYISPYASSAAGTANAKSGEVTQAAEDNPYQKNLKNIQGSFLRGMNLDMEA